MAITLKWDQVSERRYEDGVDRVVLFPIDKKGAYQNGVAWNGVTKVTDSPEAGSVNTIYANNNTYLKIRSKSKFKGSISAYMYPDEFAPCIGLKSVTKAGQAVKGLTVDGQTPTTFGYVYRSGIGNDTEGLDHGYKLHFVYNASATISSQDHNTVGENTNPQEFSWEIEATEVEIPEMEKSAHIIVNSLETPKEVLKKLEEKIYGDGSKPAEMPTPEELVTILTAGV